jgi:hypothetical protein
MTYILKNKYDDVVSLGCNCFPANYIRIHVKQKEALYFD